MYFPFEMWSYVGWGKILGEGVFCLYLHVISFDFDSGVGIPVTLTFWPGGVNTLAKPPQRPCVNVVRVIL